MRQVRFGYAEEPVKGVGQPAFGEQLHFSRFSRRMATRRQVGALRARPKLLRLWSRRASGLRLSWVRSSLNISAWGGRLRPRRTPGPARPSYGILRPTRASPTEH